LGSKERGKKGGISVVRRINACSFRNRVFWGEREREVSFLKEGGRRGEEGKRLSLLVR